MPTTTTGIKLARKAILSTINSVRSRFDPGTPDLEILSRVLQNGHGELTPASLEVYAKTKKHFSTADVMQYFQVGKYKVAGSLASLTRAKKIRLADEKDANGYSQYVWVKP